MGRHADSEIADNANDKDKDGDKDRRHRHRTSDRKRAKDDDKEEDRHRSSKRHKRDSHRHRRHRDREDDDNDNNDNDNDDRSKSGDHKKHRRKEDPTKKKKSKKSIRSKKSKKHRRSRHDDKDDDCDSTSSSTPTGTNTNTRTSTSTSTMDHHKKRSDRKKTLKSVKTKVVPPDKSRLYQMGDPIGRPPDPPIDPSKDYFTYHQEFWVYLYREEGIRFNDLTSELGHEAFGRFASMFNQGQLEAPYYEHGKLPQAVLEESKTTQHKWSFQTTATERKGLEALQVGVRRLTEYNNKEAVVGSIGAGNNGNGNGNDDGNGGAAAGFAKAPSRTDSKDEGRRDGDRNDFRRKTPDERIEERRANRRLRDHVRNTQEELAGGPKDHRERQQEKRKEHATRIHGAARDKEEGGGSLELNDATLYGGDDSSSFQNALARQRQSKARRQEERSKRVEELQSKEKERQENMLKMLGLDGMAGQKIKIAPRKEG